MPEDKAALLQHYHQSRSDLLAAIEDLTEAQLTEPSLDGWSVKDHLTHLAAWDDIRASEVTRISAGHDSAWRMTGEQDQAYNAMSYTLRKGFSLGQVRWELEQSRERLLSAIASAADRALDTSLYGEAPIRSTHETQHAQWIKNWSEGKRA